MSKRKGFTIAEIIISVALIALIGIVIVINLNNQKTTSGVKDYTTFVKKIESSADVYLTNNQDILNQLYTNKAYLVLTVEELIDAGLIEENFVNPKTNEVIDAKEAVRVNLDSEGVIKFTYPSEANYTEEYLQLLNLSVENGETVTDCMSRNNTASSKVAVGLVGKMGTLETENLDKYEITCNIKDIDTTKSGTYPITYNYKTSDGVSKSATRNITVNNPLVLNIEAKNNQKTIDNNGWSNEDLTLTLKEDRAFDEKSTKWYVNEEEKTSSTNTYKITETTSKLNKYKAEVIIKGRVDETFTRTYTVEGTYGVDKTVLTATSAQPVILTKKINAKSTVNSGTWSNENLVSTVSTTVNNPSGIKFYYCTSSSDNCTPTTEYSSAVTINALGSNYFRVKAVTGAGNESKVMSYNTKIDLTAPTGVSGTHTKNTMTVRASEDYSPITNYECYVGTTNNFANATRVSTTSSGSCSLGTLKINTQYYGFVKATNAAGLSSTSPAVSIKNIVTVESAARETCQPNSSDFCANGMYVTYGGKQFVMYKLNSYSVSGLYTGADFSMSVLSVGCCNSGWCRFDYLWDNSHSNLYKSGSALQNWFTSLPSNRTTVATNQDAFSNGTYSSGSYLEQNAVQSYVGILSYPEFNSITSKNYASGLTTLLSTAASTNTFYYVNNNSVSTISVLNQTVQTRPVVHFRKTVQFVSGTGSQSDPFVIGA